MKSDMREAVNVFIALRKSFVAGLRSFVWMSGLLAVSGWHGNLRAQESESSFSLLQYQAALHEAAHMIVGLALTTSRKPVFAAIGDSGEGRTFFVYREGIELDPVQEAAVQLAGNAVFSLSPYRDVSWPNRRNKDLEDLIQWARLHRIEGEELLKLIDLANELAKQILLIHQGALEILASRLTQKGFVLSTFAQSAMDSHTTKKIPRKLDALMRRCLTRKD